MKFIYVPAGAPTFELVSAQKKEGVTAPRSYSDYSVKVDESNLPKGVTCIRMG